MTKFDDNESDALAALAGAGIGNSLRTIAINKGMEVATLFLSEVVKAHATDPFLQGVRVTEEMTAKEISDEMTMNFQSMIHTFIISLLRTVQKTDQLIAATGLLTSEGIPWDAENFEPDEIFAEADRIVKEAEDKAREAQGKGSH